MRTKLLVMLATLSLTGGTGALAADAHSAHAQPGEQKSSGHDMHAMHDEHMGMMQEMQDRNDIEDLMWRYARALDSLDADAYAAVYAEDGQFGTGEKAVKGRESLKNLVLGVKKNRDDRIAKGEKPLGTQHMVTNHTITFQDKDHATVNAYWLEAFLGQGAESPARVGAVGRSVEQMVRVSGKWLIKVRDVTP
jgi:3-phenylpropionate/cinnamic acid dioxygenase small subunit